MPIGGSRMGYGASGPNPSGKYKKTPATKGHKTVSAMKPTSRKKKKGKK